MKAQYIGLKSLVGKEVKRVFRIWKQTILPPIVTTSLYFLIFGSFIGSQIGDINGVSYINFLVPGFIMMSLITSSYMNVASSFFGAKFQKFIEEIITSPLSHVSIIIGFLSGGVVRGFLISIIVFIIAHFFTDISLAHPILAFLFVFFTASLFSFAGFLNAFFAKSFDDVNLIPTFIITPMVYLAGVFYPISSLTGIWYTLSHLNPIYYMVNGLRYSFLGVSEVNVGISLFALILSNFILFAGCLWLFKKGYGLKS
ncbi:MAG: ABC transporter permease [Candidatus Altimarinota bacterium]